ncbi:GNAT family N-acetyltransferase [Nocardia grenadensis]|uniref:GNAT family N-acetyltransferase n=1 Tax=Nocardia grenadensis TaxID=931537 RepID=UPI0007A391B1|nr:GNAT family N-acetyltransferase [Nocardia grenadensis]
MLIRPITPDDWPLARRVRLDALAGSPPGTFSTTHADAFEWDEQQWREWTARRYPFFVAESGSGPVGSAGAIVTPDGPELVSMWTAPRARRTGVSDRLVRAVVEWATQGGHPSLRLWVLDGNRSAEQLYLRNGFTPTGASRPCAEDDPRPENEMILPLPTS